MPGLNGGGAAAAVPERLPEQACLDETTKFRNSARRRAARGLRTKDFGCSVLLLKSPGPVYTDYYDYLNKSNGLSASIILGIPISHTQRIGLQKYADCFPLKMQKSIRNGQRTVII